MDAGYITIGGVGVVLTLIAQAFGVYKWVTATVASERMKSEAEVKDLSAQLSALRRDFDQFRVEVALTYASGDALKHTEAKLEDAIEKLGAKIDAALMHFLRQEPTPR